MQTPWRSALPPALPGWPESKLLRDESGLLGRIFPPGESVHCPCKQVLLPYSKLQAFDVDAWSLTPLLSINHLLFTITLLVRLLISDSGLANRDAAQFVLSACQD